MGVSSLGELFRLRDPWLRVTSTASGRFAREIDTRALPSVTDQNLCLEYINDRSGSTYLSVLLGTFPLLPSLGRPRPGSAIARLGKSGDGWVDRLL